MPHPGLVGLTGLFLWADATGKCAHLTAELVEEDEENLVQEEISGESANPDPSFLMVEIAEISEKSIYFHATST